jgi:hypothetical protein
LVEFCQYLIEEWPGLKEDAEPYGDVLARYVKLRDALQQLA